MKKIFSLMLAAGFVFSTVGCDEKKDTAKKDSKTESKKEETKKEAEKTK
jgi:hypothetical protein